MQAGVLPITDMALLSAKLFCLLRRAREVLVLTVQPFDGPSMSPRQRGSQHRSRDITANAQVNSAAQQRSMEGCC